MIINNKKKTFISILVLISGMGIFLLVRPVSAGWAANVIGGLIGMIISALGIVLSLVISALVAVAQYSNFIGAPAVTNGWQIVRDVCNMFFIVILLVIAFATILNIESYSYKKWLPKLILMAVLINFSKTICGLLIDVTQVVMLTFVNAFKDVAAGNLVTNLGLTDIMNLSKSPDGLSDSTVVGSYVLGLIYVLISIVVIVTMLAMLIMRVVMIWVYVVLSPAAYLLSAFPGGQKYAGEWWSEFTKNLIVGPVLAFFIWLSFASLNAPETVNQFKVNSTTPAGKEINAVDPGDTSFAATVASTPNAFIKFVIAIGMLIGGLKIAQEIGGAAGGLAGKGMSSLQKGAKIGMGGIAAATGYRYASGVMKSYTASRKAKREESYKLGAEKLAGGIGKVKQTAMKPVNQLGTFVKNNTYNRNGVKAQKAAQAAKEARNLASLSETNFKAKQDFGNWKYNDSSSQWEREYTNPKTRKKTTRVKTEAEMKSFVESSVTRLQDFSVKKENQSKDYRTKQNKIDKAVKYAMPVVGATAGILTGGLGGVALAAGLGIGVPKIGSSIKHAGETDLGLASNYRLRQITEAKDKMKMDSNDDVLATMDDASKSAFTRAAAAMEAMDRSLLSLNDATNKKDEIKSVIGGKTADGGWKDKKVGSYVENMMEKKYPGATKVFEDRDHPDLASSDPKKRAAAEKKQQMAKKTIASNYESGIYSLDLDTGTLEKSINTLAMVMRNGEFAKQFKALKSQSKKDSLVKALKSDGSQGAKEKLAIVKDLDFAFGADQAGKEKALSNFSLEDLADVFIKGTAVQQQAIKDAVSGSAVVNKIDIFANAKNELAGTSPAMNDMRTKLGI